MSEIETKSFSINAQYLKDLSFENPNAPESLIMEGQPEMDVALDVRARNIKENIFESELSIHVTAKDGEQTKFIIECVYAGIFTLDAHDKEELEMILLVETPKFLFPFARQIVGNIVQNGGFPPLFLEPINFLHLYLQKKQKVEESDLESENFN
jgi:preprotein translocase subunit SecB